MILAEDSVELSECDMRQRIALVDEEHLRVVDVADVDRAGEDIDGLHRRGKTCGKVYGLIESSSTRSTAG